MIGYRLRALCDAEILVLCIVWRGHADPWATWLTLLNQLVSLGYVEPYEWTGDWRSGDAHWSVWEIIYEVEKVIDVEEFPEAVCDNVGSDQEAYRPR